MNDYGDRLWYATAGIGVRTRRDTNGCARGHRTRNRDGQESPCTIPPVTDRNFAKPLNVRRGKDSVLGGR